MRFLITLAAALFVTLPAFADDDLDCQAVSGHFNPTESTVTFDWVSLVDQSLSASSNNDVDDFIVSRDMLVWGLRAEVGVAPGSGDLWSVFLQDDGTALNVSCTITDTNTTCSSPSTTMATVAAGSDLVLFVSSAGGAGTPATTGEMRFSFCLSRKR